MIDDAELSAFRDGDLPEARAAVVRAALARDPALAARLARLDQLVAALEALPDALPAPSLRPRRRRWGWAAGAIAAAASFALGVALPRPGPEPVVLLRGAQQVDGRAELLAGDVWIAIDGRARVTMEPPAGPARGGLPEGFVARNTLVGALAGAAVTVAVYEGRALVRPGSADAAPIEVVAGESRTVGGPAGASPAGRGAAAGTAPEARIAALESELAAAREALAASELVGAVSRGQLAAMQGEPSKWPADAPEALRPDAFRRGLEAQVAALPGVEIAEVDCAEYPCLAALRYVGDPAAGDEWERPVGDAVRSWLGGALPEEGLSLSLNGSRFRGDHGDARYVIFAAHGPEVGPEVDTRTGFRMDTLVDALGSALSEP